MKLMIALSLAIVFISFYSILFVFDSTSRVNTICLQRVCDQSAMNSLLNFSFAVVFMLALITIVVIYIILKQASRVGREPYREKTGEERLRELENKHDEIVKSEKETEDRYYKNDIDKETFNRLMQRYEAEMIKTDVEMKELKKKLKGKRKES